MPRKISTRAWAQILLMLIMTFAGLNTHATNKETNVELYVSAAASLTNAIIEIQNNYQMRNPQIKIHLNLASSGKLQTQIEQGAPTDLFISAAQRQMDALEEQNLIIKETRLNLLKNQLVLIVPKGSKLILQDFKELDSDYVRKISLGAPESVPAGQYAKAVLEFWDLWERLQGKMVFGTNVRAVLTYVETENVDAGIVYRTDAAISEKVKIVAVAPAGSHKPILYPAAVVSGAKEPKRAADFLTYLTGPEAKAVFEKYGFVTAEG